MEDATIYERAARQRVIIDTLPEFPISASSVAFPRVFETLCFTDAELAALLSRPLSAIWTLTSFF
jgi:hypothetical protein